MKLKKLNPLGVAHHLLMVFLVLAVAIGGTYELVASRAATKPHAYEGHIGLATCSTIHASAHDANYTSDYVQIKVVLSGGPLSSPVTLGPTQVAGPNSTEGSNTATWDLTKEPKAAAVINSTKTGNVTVTEHVYHGGSAASNEVSFTGNPNKTATITEPCKAPSGQTVKFDSAINGKDNTNSTVNADIEANVACMTQADSNSSPSDAYLACQQTCGNQAYAFLNSGNSAAGSSLNGACGITYECGLKKINPDYDASGVDCSQGYQHALDAYQVALNGVPIKLFPAQGPAFANCHPSYNAIGYANQHTAYPTPCANGLFVLGDGVWYNKEYIGPTARHIYTDKEQALTATPNLLQPGSTVANEKLKGVKVNGVTVTGGTMYVQNANGPQSSTYAGCPKSQVGSTTITFKVSGIYCVKDKTTTGGTTPPPSTGSKTVTLNCSSITSSPATFTPGKGFTVTARIANSGNTLSSALTLKVLEYQGSKVTTTYHAIGSLAAGTSKLISTPITPPSGTTKVTYPSIVSANASGVTLSNKCVAKTWTH